MSEILMNNNPKYLLSYRSDERKTDKRFYLRIFYSLELSKSSKWVCYIHLSKCVPISNVDLNFCIVCISLLDIKDLLRIWKSHLMAFRGYFKISQGCVNNLSWHLWCCLHRMHFEFKDQNYYYNKNERASTSKTGWSLIYDA